MTQWSANTQRYRGYHSEERETCREARRRRDITKGLVHVRLKKLNVSSSLGRVIGTGAVMSVSDRGGLIGPHSTHVVRRTYPLCLYVLSASPFFFIFTIPVSVHQCILSNGSRSEAIVCGCWEASSTHVHT